MNDFHKGRAFVAACTGMLLFGVVFLSLGTVSTFLQAKFSLSQAATASLASSLPFGMLAGTLLFGPVADRYGYKYLLVVPSLLIVLALELLAWAPSLWVLQLSFFFIGMGGGALNGATNALAADVTPVNKGAKLSLLGVFFGIGALGMPALTGILTRFFAYETVISATGWVLLVPGLFFILISFPAPKHKQGFPVREGLALLKEPFLILAGLILFFESGLEGLVSNWTTTFLENRNISPEKALFALSVQVAALVIARLMLSRLLKKYPPLTILLFCLTLIISGSLLLFFVEGYEAVVVSMILFGVGFSAGFPVMLGITGERYPTLSGTAFSMVIIMALIGNTLLNYVTGVVSEAWGIRFFPLLLGACVLIMGGLVQVLKRWKL
jgi:MFS family permease